jgi:transcriptional regulator with XRE-family HTH domain
MKPTQEFGYKLKQLRKDFGKSQTEVANEIAKHFPNKIRISQTTLSVLEQKADLPRVEILDVLSRYFGVPIAYFYPTIGQEERIEQAQLYLESLRYKDYNNSSENKDIDYEGTF